MKAQETNINFAKDRERFSRRLQNGVEILEHETHRTITFDEGRYESRNSQPRLVIGDALTATRTFIAKTRSDIRGLNSLLRSIAS